MRFLLFLMIVPFVALSQSKGLPVIFNIGVGYSPTGLDMNGLVLNESTLVPSFNVYVGTKDFGIKAEAGTVNRIGILYKCNFFLLGASYTYETNSSIELRHGVEFEVGASFYLKQNRSFWVSISTRFGVRLHPKQRGHTFSPVALGIYKRL